MKRKMGFLLVPIIFAFVAGGAFAASSNYFVERDVSGDIKKILPYAAMCSVHAYNIGDTRNVGGQNKEEMDKVVALKANLITREMKKQYDYLDATVKRFQIQLQKAILVAQAEAAGAPSSSSSGSGAPSTTLSGAMDCSNRTRGLTVECLRGNNRAMTGALASNNYTAIRNQIQSDLRVITTMPYDPKMMTGNCANMSNTNETANICAASKLNGKIGVQNCLACMSRATSLIEEYQVRSTSSNTRS